MKKEQELGRQSHKGVEFEVGFGEGNKLKGSGVSDTMEYFEEHGKKVGPILEEMGIDQGEPQSFPVHNTIHRGEQICRQVLLFLTLM